MSSAKRQQASYSSHFEELANETIYQIFEHLDMYHIYHAFFDLNSRFRNLIMDADELLKINMKYLSKANAKRYYTQFILPNRNRIHSLHLWNPCLVEIGCSSLDHIPKFTKLRTLVLENVLCEGLLDSLSTLPNLRSLIIIKIVTRSGQYINLDSIIRLPVLKYCKIHCAENILFDIRDEYINNRSSIEHLVHNGRFYLGNLVKILSYLPHLYRLSADCIDDMGSTITSTVCNKLTHVSLNLNNICFDRFEPFITYISKNVEVLCISINRNDEYLDAKRWERIILSSITRLRIFDIQCIYRILLESDENRCHKMIRQFKSSFWTERQWYFAHQHSSTSDVNTEMFYSTQPYRRRDYMLYGNNKQLNAEPLAENGFNRVNRVHIQKLDEMDNCSFYFPNVHKITIGNCRYTSHFSNIEYLNRTVPLRQLEQINIESNTVYSDEMLEILGLASNCYKLVINHIERSKKVELNQNYERDFDLICIHIPDLKSRQNHDRRLDLGWNNDGEHLELGRYLEEDRERRHDYEQNLELIENYVQDLILKRNHERLQFASHSDNIM